MLADAAAHIPYLGLTPYTEPAWPITVFSVVVHGLTVGLGGGLRLLLDGQRRGKWAALEVAGSSTRGSGWAPCGPAASWECRAAQSRQAPPEEAQAPSSGTAKEAL